MTRGSDRTTNITRAAVLGHYYCERKAYLKMFTGERGEAGEYAAVMERAKERTRLRYLRELARNGLRIEAFTEKALQDGAQSLADAVLSTERFGTECALLLRVAGRSRFGEHRYEPVICAPAHELRQEDRLEVLFAGYVLSEVQGAVPAHGTVVLLGGGSARVRIADGMKHLTPHLHALGKWLREPPAPVPVVLNKHCRHCEFQGSCRPIAEREDSLSLLGGMTRKILARYEQKGIFTVKQLSYLYKPRKPMARRKPRLAHQYELQALALRTGNIYLHEPRALADCRSAVFLDIESIPGRRFYYLIGLLVCTAQDSRYLALWAERETDEASIWRRFIDFVEAHPELPLLHYGAFESRAILELGRRYGTPVDAIIGRLLNINACIFGRIYFPVHSNGLKDIGRYLGLSWSSAPASGLQAIVWRYRYEETGDERYRGLLLTYNREDCENLRALARKLRDILARARDIPEVRTADRVEGHLTPAGSEIVGQLTGILKSAHLTYEKSKIALKHTRPPRAVCAARAGGRSRKRPKAHAVVAVEPARRCPHHPEQALKATASLAQHTRIDLTFTGSGVKKTVTRTVGRQGFCARCKNRISPPQIRQLNRDGKFGHGLRAWTVYHRLALRLSYRSISQLIGDLFGEDIKPGALLRFINQAGEYYAQTETVLLRRILASPAVHVDETSINIRGQNWYVWVFTDGRRAVFRLTQTRESTVVHEIMAGYGGVLISDFYAGYDAVECTQQKCWAHLIRDLNEDLRTAPFDAELERFVSGVRDLMVPVFAAVEAHGAKSGHLRKFTADVERFYARYVADAAYQSNLAQHYRKRFARYKDGLFVFLTRDGIAWNNNMAERAIRHLAVQRKISGSFFESGMQHYLLLLGIAQTCRFQGKSLLEFLLSASQDVDAFQVGTKDFGSGIEPTAGREDTGHL